MRDLIHLLQGASRAVQLRGAIRSDKVHAVLLEEGVVVRDFDRQTPDVPDGVGEGELVVGVAALHALGGCVAHVVVYELTKDHQHHRETGGGTAEGPCGLSGDQTGTGKV